MSVRHELVMDMTKRVIDPPEEEFVQSFIARVMMGAVNLRMMETRMRVKLHGRMPLLCLVFCGGKSGSSTLHRLFVSMDIPSVRIHNMDHFVDEYAPFLRGNPARSRLHLDVLLRFFSAFYERVIVLDAYRDPVERRLSSFFQNFQVNLSRGGITHGRWQTADFPSRVQIFQNCIMPLLENRNGLDSMSLAFLCAEFDFEKRYQKMAHPVFPSVTLIKLRFVDIRDWQRILQSALPELTIPALSHENDSEGKSYAEEYKKWREEFRFIRNDFLWKLVLDPVFCKYHSSSELIRYFEKWASPMVPVTPTPPMDDKQTQAVKNFMELYKRYV